MAHKCDFIERFEIYNGHLARVVKAYWAKGKKELDVYVEVENGVVDNSNCWYRNIAFSTIGGYTVYFPDEKQKYGWGYTGYSWVAKLEEWSPTYNMNGVMDYNRRIKNEDIEKVLMLYPEFKYCLKKMNLEITYKLLFNIIQMWAKHPEIEGLLALDLTRIALNNSLFKLSEKKRKEVIQFIVKNKDSINKDLTLQQIQKMLKYKMSFKELNEYEHFMFCNNTRKITVDQFRYLTKKGLSDYQNTRLYLDYLEMANKAGHNLKDEYWLYPSDLNKAHNKVMEELKNISNMNTKLRSDMLNEVLKDLYQYNCNINGYDVFVTSDMNIIQKQCDVLFQCLIRNDYINKVINQEEILVFVWKDGKPVATAEVFYNKTIGQFYGDERDRTKCQASDELKEILNKYLSRIKKLKKRKFNVEKKFYYKGFQDKVDDKHFHTSYGDFTFAIGGVYETPFKDDEIVNAGGKNCVATNKVFHFCDSIEEIQKHYNPKYYCIVEPLGPILEHNGALLSNKIKIVKEVFI